MVMFSDGTDEPCRGYVPLHVGDTLYHGEFEIVRKLGWSINSSVWLAKLSDSVLQRARADNPEYVAIKVLTAHATADEADELSYELELTAKMREMKHDSHPGVEHCLTLQRDYFWEHSVHGLHLCLVFDPCGSTLEGLRYQQSPPRFPLAVVKRFMKQVLLALDFLHTRCSAVHCDVKLANVLVKIDRDPAVISRYLREHPSESYSTRNSPDLYDAPIITTKSQPLPNFGLDASLSNLDVYLADFGSAIPLEDLTWYSEPLTPVLFKAPEQILGCAWSTPADIWAVGCMVFSALTGREVFRLYRKSDSDDTTDVHLARIVEHIGPFPAAFLKRCRKRTQYFDRTGGYLKAAKPDGGPLENRLSKALSDTLDSGDMQQTAAFIRRCLTIDPDDRATAAQLLEDPWLAP
ncbi:kinase-like protein [Trametes sanguinea]|nr:kinase-like protein [Trametes sanguinea]